MLRAFAFAVFAALDLIGGKARVRLSLLSLSRDAAMARQQAETWTLRAGGLEFQLEEALGVLQGTVTWKPRPDGFVILLLYFGSKPRARSGAASKPGKWQCNEPWSSCFVSMLWRLPVAVSPMFCRQSPSFGAIV